MVSCCCAHVGCCFLAIDRNGVRTVIMIKHAFRCKPCILDPRETHETGHLSSLQRMATREEIVKQNLEFVYGKNDQAKLEDPDKVSYRAPKTKFVDVDAIVDFTGEYEFLAPSFPCPVFLQGEKLAFPSFEHALLASKFKGEDKRQEVRSTPFIRDVKRLISREKGKTSVLHADWTERCIAIAEVLLLDKFIRNRKLKEQLMKTGRRRLMFKNDFNDLYWGVDEQRKGQNHLGKLLEKIRGCIDQGNDLELWLSQQVKLIEADKVQVTMTVAKDGVVITEDCRVIDQKPKLLIGKSEDMCDISAAHPTISRVHAALLVERQTGTLFVVDLASANGTKVDGQLLNAFELTPLGAGSILTLGVSSRQYSFTVDAAADEKRKAALLKKIAGDPASLLPGANNEKHTENTVFVGNISFDTSETEISAFFTPCGTITQLSVPMDRATGKHKGIAFVTFADFKGVMQALARDNDELGGRNVKVKKSDAKKPGQADGKRDNRPAGGSGAHSRSTQQSEDAGKYGPQKVEGTERRDDKNDRNRERYAADERAVKSERTSRGEADSNKRPRSRSPVRRGSGDDDKSRRSARSPSQSRSPGAHRRNSHRDSGADRRGRASERSPERRQRADSRDRPARNTRDRDHGRDSRDRDNRKRQRSASASASRSPPRRVQRKRSPSRSRSPSPRRRPSRPTGREDVEPARAERSGGGDWHKHGDSPSRRNARRSASASPSPPRRPNRADAVPAGKASAVDRLPRRSPSSSPIPPRRQQAGRASPSASPSPPRRPAQSATHSIARSGRFPSPSRSPSRSPPRRNAVRAESPSASTSTSPPRRPVASARTRLSSSSPSPLRRSAAQRGADNSPSPPRRPRADS